MAGSEFRGCIFMLRTLKLFRSYIIKYIFGPWIIKNLLTSKQYHSHCFSSTNFGSDLLFLPSSKKSACR